MSFYISRHGFTQILPKVGVNRITDFWNSAVSAQFERLAEWVNTDVVPFLHEVRGVLQQVWDFVRPLFVLLSAVVLFPVYPWILPVVLAGWAWQAVPECLKEPIINFAIDIMILALESLPDFRNFGDAWPRAKEQIISALRDARAMDTADKIAIADRIARIMIGEDIAWIGNLIAAAREMPRHFWPQAQQELIGMDLSQPLPFEHTSAPQPRESAAAAVEARTLSAEDAAVLTSATLTERDIEVDQIASLELEPELVAGLNLDEGGEVEFGDSTDPSRSIDAIRDEMVAAGEGTPEGAMSVETTAGEQPDVEAQLQAMMDQPAPQSCENQAPSSTASQGNIPESLRIGPLTQGQRARYLLNQMGKGIRQWFSCNWHWLVPSVIGAIVLLIILEIVTGGAVTAALPPLMQIIGTILIGVAIVKTGYYLADYLAKGIAGDVTAAARSLARGLAAGAIELVFALLFNISAVIKSLKKGVGASLRAGARTVSETARRTRRAVRTLGETVARGGRTAAGNIRRVAGAALRNGRLVMNGVGRSIGRGIRSLDDLARRLWRRVRFRRFKIRRVGGRRFQLLGYINPWVILADGSITEAEQHELPPGAALGDFVNVPGLARPGIDPRGVLIGLGEGLMPADAAAIILNITTRNLTRGANFIAHFRTHRNVLRRVTHRKYPFHTHQQDFLNDIQNLIHNGDVQLVGLSTMGQGQPLVAVFRGQGVTVVTRPDGEWVTILRTGEWAEPDLDTFMRLRL